MTTFVDFGELKSRVSIVQASEILGLKLKTTGEQSRGACPKCLQGGDRALVITPAKNAFYCFGGKKGGDMISLVAHIRGTGMKDAAQFVAELSGTSTGTVPGKSTSSPSASREVAGMKPLDYLEAQHEGVQALGLDADFCQEFGIGFAPKGTMRGRILFPVRTRQGVLLGYCGIATDTKTQPRMLLPSNLDPKTAIFAEDRVSEGELRIAPDPVEACLAIQHGVQAIAFLSETVPSEQLDLLVSLMDERKAEIVF